MAYEGSAEQPCRHVAEIEALKAEAERLRGEIQKWIHYYGLGSSPLFQRVEQAEGRTRALEAALGNLIHAIDRLHTIYGVQDVAQWWAKTKVHVDEAHAALTEPTPPQGEQG